MRRALAHLVTFAVAMAVWLFALPAAAASSAPQCDPRAATTFAPAPTLQAPLTSIDVGTSDAPDCGGASLYAACHRGRTPSPDAWSDAPDAAPVSVAVPVLAPSSYLLPLTAVADGARAGVRSTIERPPRA